MHTVTTWFSNLTGQDVLMGLAGIAMVVFLVEIATWLLSKIVGKQR